MRRETQTAGLLGAAGSERLLLSGGRRGFLGFALAHET